MTERATIYPENVQSDVERTLESRHHEIAIQGLLGIIHALRQTDVGNNGFVRQRDAVQSHIRQTWPNERYLRILLPGDAVVYDYDYQVVSQGVGIFNADSFTRIDHIGAVFLNRDSGEWARFSDATSAGFEFYDRNTQGLPNYE